MRDVDKKLKDVFFYGACVIIVVVQLLLCCYQIASYWQWGHNGFNGAASQVAARNSLRYHIIWPVQYHTADTRPDKSEYYMHAPLGHHTFMTLCFALFGDRELSVRLAAATFSLLAAIMLLVLLGKHYSRPMALIATSIYVLLPINSIYCNMTNHSTACIFFALLMFDGYLDLLKKNRNISFIPLIVGLVGATFFEWPGFTMASCLGVASIYEGLKDSKGRGPGAVFNKIFLLGLFLLIYVFVTFSGFILWVKHTQGLGSFMTSITERSQTGDLFGTMHGLYKGVLTRIFPEITRLIAFLWIIGMFVKHAARLFKPRDTVPVAFFVAAMAQFFLFPNALVIHEYMSWFFNPFMAIACGESIVWAAGMGGRISEFRGVKINRVVINAIFWIAILASFSYLYVPRAYKVFKAGRAVAGSFNIPNYTRDYEKIMFARLINQWTGPHDGVIIHSELSHRIEVEATLGRAWSDVNSDHVRGDVLKVNDPKRKWVFIGNLRRIDLKLLVPYTKKYRFVQVGNFFFIDLRKPGSAMTVYRFLPQKAGWAWKFFVTPYDPPLKLVRDKKMEASLKEELGKLEALPPGKSKELKEQKNPVGRSSMLKGSLLQGTGKK